MYNYIEDFPTQIDDALLRINNWTYKHDYSSLSSVVICGLGGSGIAGDLVYDFTVQELEIPFTVNKTYNLPKSVNKRTLVILSSYSGNTEETIQCAKQTVALGLKPICITSGGQLKNIAIENDFDLIELPTGFPPRTTLAYGAVNLFGILKRLSLIKTDVLKEMKSVSDFLSKNKSVIKERAVSIAKELNNKTIVIYSDDLIESAALRFKQQINENAKAFCWHNVLPELNHNELVGYKMRSDAIAAYFMRTDFENPRNAHRFAYMEPIVRESVGCFLHIQAEGKDLFEQYFYHVNLGDWISYYLALEHAQDPIEVKVLDKLKSYMNSIE